MSSRPSSSARNRRRRSNERDQNVEYEDPNDNNALVIDIEDDIPEEKGKQLQDSLHATIALGMNDGTRKNYRNRIEKLIKFLQTHYPLYCVRGIRDLTPEEISDRTKFYFGKSRDIVYTGFNVKLLLFFILIIIDEQMAN